MAGTWHFCREREARLDGRSALTISPLPLELNPQRTLMRLHRGAEFGVVVEIDAGVLLRLSEADAPASAPYWLSPMPCSVMLWLPRLTVTSEKFCTKLSTNLP